MTVGGARERSTPARCVTEARPRGRALVRIVALFSVIAAPRAFAVTCNVTTADSAATIQQRLDDAGCTSIHVAPGTYSGNFVVSRSNVLIFGDDELNTYIGGAAPASSVFRITGATVTLSHLTIENGTGPFGAGVYVDGGAATISACRVRNNSGFGPTSIGGGVLARSGSVLIEDSTITNNRAAFAGGGVAGTALAGGAFSQITIRRTAISGNLTGIFGGGIYNDLGTVVVEDSDIDSNLASTGAFAFGGGIANNIGGVTVRRSTVRRNRAVSTSSSAAGGGINNAGAFVLSKVGTVSIEDNTTISENEAAGFLLGTGGGINNANGGSLIVRLSTVQANLATSGAGIDSSDHSTVTLTDAIVRDNVASSPLGAQGGGIRSKDSVLTVTTSSIFSNTAKGPGVGGGIYADGTLPDPFSGSVTINSSTIGSNTANAKSGAGGQGGGIYFNSLGGTVNLRVTINNSTFAGNAADTTGESIFRAATGGGTAAVTLNCSILQGRGLHASCSGSSITSLGYNVANDATCSLIDVTDKPTVDAKLFILDNNGGPTPTIGLKSGSPAVNTGSTTCPATDQRGQPRPIDGGCDSGSFEAADFYLLSHAPLAEPHAKTLPAYSLTFSKPAAAPIIERRALVFESALSGRVPGAFTFGTTTTLAPSHLFAGDRIRVTASRRLIRSDDDPADVSLQNPQQWQHRVLPSPACVGKYTALSETFGGAPDPAAIAWGDYDRDNDLDLLVSGILGTVIYQNNGGAFTAVVEKPGLQPAAVAWGDYDNDGDLDFVAAGTDFAAGKLVVNIYRNDGANTFVKAVSLTGVDKGTVAWGDYDNDGDLDLLVTGGQGLVTGYAGLYSNEGGDVFKEVPLALPQVRFGSAAFGDVDGDGDLDIAIIGYDHGVVAKLFVNSAVDGFVETASQLVPVQRGTVSFGDLNGDGKADLVVIGEDATGAAITRVYRAANGTLELFPTQALPDVSRGAAVLTDYDDDGSLDVVLTGRDASGNPFTGLFKNTGNGSSFSQIDVALTNVRDSALAVGDFDDDGDIDIALTGWNGTDWVRRAFRQSPCTVGNDTYTMPTSGTLTLPAPGVLLNDVHAQAVTVTGSGVPAGATLGSDGALTFVPPAPVPATYNFTYTFKDGGNHTSPTANVSIVVQPVGNCRATIDGLTVYASANADAVQAAVNAATSGQKVKVAGTCAGVSTISGATQTVRIAKSVTLEGGYSPTSFEGASDPRAFPTVLDAQQLGRVVATASGATTIKLHGLILKGGLTSGGGAGVLHAAGTLTMELCELASNTATSSNGGGILSSAPLFVTQSLFVGNSATQGAGVASSASTADIRNTTFANGIATNGGGVAATGGAVVIKNCTLAQNGVNELYQSSGSIGVTDSILEDATSGNVCAGAASSITSGGHNLVGDTSCAFTSAGDHQSATAVLEPLADNGGATRTFALGASAKLNGSVAIDGGASCENADQRGVSRPAACDIGAYESPFVNRPCRAHIDLPSVQDFVASPPNNDATVIINALAAASSGSTVKISGECNAPDKNADPLLTVNKSITLEGGYDGTSWTTHDYAANPTTINGHVLDPLTPNAQVQLIQMPDTVSGTRTLNLKGLILTKGRVSGIGGDDGAAVHVEDHILSIDSCSFIDNISIINASVAGIKFNALNAGRSLTIINSRFEKNVNSEATGGGAIDISSSQDLPVTITNSTFIANEAPLGGAIKISHLAGADVTLNITGSRFERNKSESLGGAIWNWFNGSENGAAVTISRTTFSGNSGTTGGAIYQDGQLTITNSTFEANTATNEGSAINLDSSSARLSIDSSTFSGNRGGATIFDEAENMVITNSTISGNTAAPASNKSIVRIAPSGGPTGRASLTGVTITGNTPTGTGGALDSSLSHADNILTDVILTNNVRNCQSTTHIVSGGHNLADDATCGLAATGDKQNGNANLDPLADNGGATKTHMPKSGDAIDTGDCAGLTVDQRNLLRPAGVACDIGAVERTGVTTTAALLSNGPTGSGQPALFTATVTAANGAIPTGAVQIKEGAVILGSANVDGLGVAILSATALSTASHSIVAFYVGNATFDASTSPTITHVVNAAATFTNLTSIHPSPSNVGELVTFSAKATPVSPAAGTPSGSILVSDGSASCTITLPATSCQTALAIAGERQITATFTSSTPSFTGSVSLPTPQTVVEPSPPQVIAVSTAAGILTNGQTVIAPVTALSVAFSQDMNDPVGSTDALDITNPAQALLVSDGGDGFQTAACAAGAIGNDVAIPIGPVAYNAGSRTLTLNVNGGVKLPDGNYRLFLCSSISDIDFEHLSPFAISFGIDTTPPTVTRVNSVADTGDAVVVENELTNAAITKLIVTLDAVRTGGASDAGDNKANYKLIAAGGNGVFDTTTCAAGVSPLDTNIAIDSLTYSSSVATLSVNGGVALPSSSYRLIACPSIADAAGNALDGNADGTGGDEFVRNFTVDMTGAGNATLTSTDHTPNVWSNDNTISVQWSGASDPSGIAGYSIAVNTAAATGADTTIDVVEASPHVFTFGPLGDSAGYYVHLRTCDMLGNCSSDISIGPFPIDTVPPIDPPLGSVQSTDHATGTWSNDSTITVQWTAGSDNFALAGYSVLFDHSPSTLPDATIEVPAGPDPRSATSAPVTDGDDIYFHLRTCDLAGNCTHTVHLGPFLIDTVPPTTPAGLNATAATDVLNLTWTTAVDAASGLAGYQVTFTQSATASLAGPPGPGASATSASSTKLTSGNWYAHIAAVDAAGNWSPTANFGPVAIAAAAIPLFSGATLLAFAVMLALLAALKLRG